MDEKQSGLLRVSRVISGGLVALFCALIFGALTVFGVINMMLGHVLLFAAWIVGCFLIAAEILPGKPTKHKVIWVLILGLLMLLGDIGIIYMKAHEHPESAYVPPIAPSPVPAASPSIPSQPAPVVKRTPRLIKPLPTPAASILEQASIGVVQVTLDTNDALHLIEAPVTLQNLGKMPTQGELNTAWTFEDAQSHAKEEHLGEQHRTITLAPQQLNVYTFRVSTKTQEDYDRFTKGGVIMRIDLKLKYRPNPLIDKTTTFHFRGTLDFKLHLVDIDSTAWE